MYRRTLAQQLGKISQLSHFHVQRILNPLQDQVKVPESKLNGYYEFVRLYIYTWLDVGKSTDL